jgi:hypothetical protein
VKSPPSGTILSSKLSRHNPTAFRRGLLELPMELMQRRKGENIEILQWKKVKVLTRYFHIVSHFVSLHFQFLDHSVSLILNPHCSKVNGPNSLVSLAFFHVAKEQSSELKAIQHLDLHSSHGSHTDAAFAAK